LTPIDDASGLTPVSGLTPIDDSSGLTPIATSGLTPVPSSRVGLTPLNITSEPLTAAIVSDVDDGKSLIPLREQTVTAALTVSNPYDWSESTSAAGAGLLPMAGSTKPAPTTLGPATTFALTATMIGLCASGVLQVVAAIIFIVVALTEPGTPAAIFIWFIALVLGLIQLFGGFLIQQRRGYGWCVAASIIALFNLCLGTPAGILGLIMLLQSPVRAAFAARDD
jgi:hypothetical protein